MTRVTTERRWQRVILRSPLPATVDDHHALVLEIGARGAKIEHDERFKVGTALKLGIGAINLSATVRYSTMQPSAGGGFVYHSGVEFQSLTDADTAAIFELLLKEAQAQVRDWEANFRGISVPPAPRRARSSVPRQYVWLRLGAAGWERYDSSDPNQPIDGIAVAAGEPEESVELLCRTYVEADEAGREYLRRCAALAILEAQRQD